jgi:hypothetical protein
MGTWLVPKDENIVANRVFAQGITHNSGQSIKAIAHIGGLATLILAQAGT